MVSNDILPFTDIETFGLDADTCPIIEIGIHVVDLNLDTLNKTSWLVWDEMSYERLGTLIKAADNGDKDAKWVYDTHADNGLWEAAQKWGRPAHIVEIEIVNWLNRNEFDGLPMCGSSVHFDQRFLYAQMPDLAQTFHYRIIDNSVLKELCRRYNPKIFAQAPTKQTEQHRVMPDLEDTIREFSFYRDEFLLW